MKTRILGLMVGASAAAMSFVSCSQPAIDCRVAHSGAFGFSYAALYTPVSGSGACATIGGDQLGMETYHGVAKNGDTEKQDFEKPTKVAIQAMYMGVLSEDREDLGQPFDEDPNHKRYAYGEFDALQPDDNDICTIKSLAPAEQVLPVIPAIPAVPCDAADCKPCTTDADCTDENFATCDPDALLCIGEGMVCDAAAQTCEIPEVPEVPQQSIKYEWSDVNAYVTAASGGTQVQAHLKYTEDGCTAEYTVTAIWPSINCTLHDADFNPILDADGNPQADDTACCPEGDVTRGRSFGSGINPDYPVKCVDIGGFDWDNYLPNFVCALDMSYSKDGKIPVIKEGWALDKNKAPACQPLKASATSE
jgi:hypothetical protein